MYPTREPRRCIQRGRRMMEPSQTARHYTDKQVRSQIPSLKEECFSVLRKEVCLDIHSPLILSVSGKEVCLHTRSQQSLILPCMLRCYSAICFLRPMDILERNSGHVECACPCSGSLLPALRARISRLQVSTRPLLWGL